MEWHFQDELIRAKKLAEVVRAPGTGRENSRLVFDPATQTVTLDDEQIPVRNPKAFLLYKAISERNGEPITRAGLRNKILGLRGNKTIPNLLAVLPAVLRETILSGPSGYWLRLPPQQIRT